MEHRFDDTNLWLAQALYELGGVTFGDYTLGRTTVNSPVYVDPRKLLARPVALKQVAELIDHETAAGQVRKRPRAHPFDLVAGVPYGGIPLATAFALHTNTPMVYVRRQPDGDALAIEGSYMPGQTALIIDDLITTGGSVLETREVLTDAGLLVRDAVVLVDREQGAAQRLKHNGINLISILRLKTMLTHYHSNALIGEDWYYRSVAYIEANQAQV